MKTLQLAIYSILVQAPLLLACGVLWLAMMWRDLWLWAFDWAEEAENFSREAFFPPNEPKDFP